MRVEQDEMEGKIAILIAKIKASSLHPNLSEIKEPCDITTEMTPLAYAFFTLLANAGEGTGKELTWGRFLHEALDECLYLAEQRSRAH